MGESAFAPVVSGDRTPACRLFAGVVGRHLVGLPAADDHEFGGGGAVCGEVLGHADSGRVSGEPFTEPGRASHGGDSAGDGPAGLQAEDPLIGRGVVLDCFQCRGGFLCQRTGSPPRPLGRSRCAGL